MTTQVYSTPAGRVNEIKGEILGHAEPVEILALGMNMRKMPKNQGDNVTYRRYIPFGATTTNVNTQNRPAATASAHMLQEGVTPAADTLTPVDVNVQLNEYACLYAYTNKAAELYEDDIPEEQKVQAGERMALVREMVRFGELKSGTNVLYAGGTTRLTVDEKIGLNVLRRMTRTLKLNHAKKKTRILGPGPNYNTFSVEAAYLVFVSTDAEADVRDLPGFTKVADYANRTPISPDELGSCEEFRFITSPELTAYASSGAAVGATGLLSTDAASVDVYPFMIMGEEAAFDVALRGSESFRMNHLPHNKPDKSDPGGQRGYIFCGFWAASKIVNGGRMGVIEAGVSALT